MNLKPWEYIRLTESEYFILCIGQKNVDLKETSYVRKLAWTMVCGYADPKKLPANEYMYWPLENDPKPKPINKKKVLKLHNLFMGTKFTKKQWQTDLV